MNINKTVDKGATGGVFSPTAIVLRGDGEPLDNTAYIHHMMIYVCTGLGETDPLPVHEY